MPKSTSEQTTILGDRYLLHEIIGRGGMADVYRATDQQRAVQVAVKLLRQSDPPDSDRGRFIAEAKTLSSLSHPRLATVLDVSADHDRLYFVMELVEGQPLSMLMKAGPMNACRLAGIGSQLADAIGYVHEQGFAHRDIKPANILIGESDHVSLADFGIARILGDLRHHTATGFTMGTAAYVSPEQVQGRQVAGATDVYSLGLVLLEALTGEQAFKGTAAEMSLARLVVQPSIPDSLGPDWCGVLQHMTAIEPGARPAIAWVERQLTAMAASSDGDDTAVLTPSPTRPIALASNAAKPEPAHTKALPTKELPTPPDLPTETRAIINASTRALSTSVRNDQAPTTTADSVRPWWQSGAARGIAVAALVAALIVCGYIALSSSGSETNAPDVPGKIGDDLQRLHEVLES